MLRSPRNLLFGAVLAAVVFVAAPQSAQAAPLSAPIFITDTPTAFEVNFFGGPVAGLIDTNTIFSLLSPSGNWLINFLIEVELNAFFPDSVFVTGSVTHVTAPPTAPPFFFTLGVGPIFAGFGSSAAAMVPHPGGTPPVDSYTASIDPLTVGGEILRFKIAIAANAVPEPSTFVLLGIGAVGLVGFGWRRRKQRLAA